MARRLAFSAVAALIALLFTASPAPAEECVEVLQYKHCVPA